MFSAPAETQNHPPANRVRMSVRRELVFPPHLWRQAQAALFGRTGVEGFAFGLARPCPRPDGLVYQVETLIAPEASGYLARTTAGLSLSDRTSSQFNQAAAAAAPHGRVPLNLHSHPLGLAEFSADDDRHEAALHHWLRAQGQPLLLSGVQARSGSRPRLGCGRQAIRSRSQYGWVWLL